MQKNKNMALGIVLLVLAVIAVLGTLTFAGPCVHEDGSMGACTWAARSLLGTSIVILILSILRLCVSCMGFKGGVSSAMGLLGILLAVTPGILINICMMSSMHCVAVMRPTYVILGIVIALVAFVDAALLHKKHKKH